MDVTLQLATDATLAGRESVQRFRLFGKLAWLLA
jgi:hypothetical protein